MSEPTNPSPAARVERSIAAKQARRPEVDSNGHPIGELVAYTYDEHGRLLDDAGTK